ncbi:MAG: helix-turn-helix domain-containing protein [Treponema sp.]|jgi:cytoskeletal protein RodZ|nr:helix-turn-helix domain-containing protein [Treponema sp.]
MSGLKFREKYGEYLTGKRKEKGLTLKQLSEKTGIPERNLLAVETENVKNFSHNTVHEFCKALGVHLGEIFYD